MARQHPAASVRPISTVAASPKEAGTPMLAQVGHRTILTVTATARALAMAAPSRKGTARGTGTIATGPNIMAGRGTTATSAAAAKVAAAPRASMVRKGTARAPDTVALVLGMAARRVPAPVALAALMAPARRGMVLVPADIARRMARHRGAASVVPVARMADRVVTSEE
ncbi:MAG: hypothetical protein CMO74_09695 [Verrucomicrobiales bacterium]|nr:hypothetical protein [Verrucomicrobiales bacterium]